MAEHTPPWKWHPKSFDQDHNGSIYSEHRTGHAYAIAMQPKYVTDEEWAVTAPLTVKAVNNHDALVVALTELYAQVKGECPSLLNEDSGGDGTLDIEIKTLLAAVGGSR